MPVALPTEPLDLDGRYAADGVPQVAHALEQYPEQLEHHRQHENLVGGVQQLSGSELYRAHHDAQHEEGVGYGESHQHGQDVWNSSGSERFGSDKRREFGTRVELFFYRTKKKKGFVPERYIINFCIIRDRPLIFFGYRNGFQHLQNSSAEKCSCQ